MSVCMSVIALTYLAKHDHYQSKDGFAVSHELRNVWKVERDDMLPLNVLLHGDDDLD